jgi:hypothetical protein
MQSDRFDTVLPKTERFFSPSKPKSQQQKPAVWGYLLTGVLIGAVFMALPRPNQQLSPGGAIPVVAPTPPPPLPEVRTAEPVHEQVSSAPRAQLVHIRAIGTYEYENDKMPGKSFRRHARATFYSDQPTPEDRPKSQPASTT